MSDDLPASAPTERADAVPDSDARYAHLRLETDEVIVYDREGTDAWIQSDVTGPVRTRADAGSGPDGVADDADERGSE